MLAKAVATVPDPDSVRGGLRYEPKWDGFRGIIFKDGDSLRIGSRKGQPLERYFPELSPLFSAALPARCVLDGEIVIPGRKGLDFEALQQRIHPAASRINRLAAETPASFVAFDLLALGEESLIDKPLSERWARLVASVNPSPRVLLTPRTDSPEVAQQWFEEFEGAGLDGVIAKRLELPYSPGERVMVKIKHERTADCVVGGYRIHKSGVGVGSMLLGLYDEQGVLQHVGASSSFSAKLRKELLAILEPLRGGVSFHEGRQPGAPNRWNQTKDVSWEPVEPKLVCEVKFDYLQGDRFRHVARFVRWRPDKAPEQCKFDQLNPPRPFSLDRILALAPKR